MAKDEEILDVEQTEETKSATKLNPKVENSKHYHGPMGWLIALVVVFFVLIVCGFVGSVAMFRHERLQNPTLTSSGFIKGERSGMRGGFRISSSIVRSNQIQISGVVTAVNGSNFTVAGNGTTNSVTTTSDTTFTGATKVNVNDSVIVVGTTNNGTFTAIQVVVNNN